MWKPEGNLWKLVLSFHHVGCGNGAQFVRLARKGLYLLSHIVIHSSIS